MFGKLSGNWVYLIVNYMKKDILHQETRKILAKIWHYWMNKHKLIYQLIQHLTKVKEKIENKHDYPNLNIIFLNKNNIYLYKNIANLFILKFISKLFYLKEYT